jgi:ribosomal protein S18 acetylase RimI-like enzyme
MQPTMSPVTTRTATAADEDFLARLFLSTRPELLSINMPEAQKEALIKMQFNAQHQQYDACYPHADSQIILRDDAPVGRMLVARSEAELVLVDIALLPEYRSAGTGSALIQQLMLEAAESRKRVRLQVFKMNPALRLYERLGFSITADQSMYWEMIFEPSA